MEEPLIGHLKSEVGMHMGLYFEVQCTECGYHETLIDGQCGLEHLDEIRIKLEFEAGEGDPVYRKIFDLLKSTVTKDDSIGDAYNFGNNEPGSDDWEETRLLFGEPYIRLTPTIYQCYHCKSFFNHDRMSIVCKRGIFKENDVECPSCKSVLTLAMSANDFFEDEGESRTESNYICKERCPKCYSKMMVINSGIVG